MRFLLGMDRIKTLPALMAAHLYAPKNTPSIFISGILDLIFLFSKKISIVFSPGGASVDLR